MIPNVPLVEGEIYGVAGVLLALHSAGNGCDSLDEVVEVHCACEEVGSVVVRVAVVSVEGEVVDVVVSLVEDCPFPAAECGHTGGR